MLSRVVYHLELLLQMLKEGADLAKTVIPWRAWRSKVSVVCKVQVSRDLPKPIPTYPLGYCTTVVGIIPAPVIGKGVHGIHSHKEVDGIVCLYVLSC